MNGCNMKQNHTKGPWKPCKSHEDYNGPYFDIDPEDQPMYDQKPIVSIQASDGTSVANAHDLFEFTEANAKLISAAPDLLDALKSCFADFMHYRPQGGEYAELGGKHADIVEAKVRAAIAKATT